LLFGRQGQKGFGKRNLRMPPLDEPSGRSQELKDFHFWCELLKSLAQAVKMRFQRDIKEYNMPINNSPSS
jgi:hypothetical protein